MPQGDSWVRGLTFGICYYDDVDGGPTDIQVHTVFANGSTSNDAIDDAEIGDAFVNSNQEGGPPDPLSEWCP
jgi:hypothetical protein